MKHYDAIPPQIHQALTDLTDRLYLYHHRTGQLPDQATWDKYFLHVWKACRAYTARQTRPLHEKLYDLEAGSV